MPLAWTMVRAPHAVRAFSGEGARRTGGRWNSPGVAVVHSSEHKSLAVWEMLVHLDPQDATRYLTFRVEFNEALVERLPGARLPTGWREHMPARASRECGDAWVRESRSVILAVPSAIIPEELNYLLNPAHPDFKKLTISKPTLFTLDPRLRTGCPRSPPRPRRRLVISRRCCVSPGPIPQDRACRSNDFLL
jgi:RES domain-containing protein